MNSEGLVALFGDRCTNIGGGGAAGGCWGRKQCGATKVTIPVTGSTTGAAIVHKEFSHRCSRWPPIHQATKRWAFPFIGVGASCKRTKGRAPGVWVQQIFTANTWCPMLPFTSGIPLFYKRVNPSHPIQTQPYRPHVELDFALNRSKLVGMSMRDYLSHASNLLHKN